MKKLFPITLAFLVFILSGCKKSDIRSAYDTISMTSYFNYNWSVGQNPLVAPSGLQSLSGIPFEFGCKGCNNYWSGNIPTNPNPVTLSIPLNRKIDTVFALVNTIWGQPNNTYASIVLMSGGNVLYQKDLYGDIDIRDFNRNPYFTTSINGTSTENVYSDANHRVLDMVKIDVPSSIKNSIIDSIVFIDNGAANFQRLAVTALSVKQYSSGH